MASHQPGVLLGPPPAARFLTFGLRVDVPPKRVEATLRSLRVGAHVTLGLGAPLLRVLGKAVDGLHDFHAVSAPGVAFPSTQGAVWACVDGADAGQALQHARALTASLDACFRLDEDVAAFTFASGKDLTGYEDGTENPKAEKAVEAALVAGPGPLAGSSFVAVQRWVHALAHFESLAAKERDHIVGRHRATNEELTDAPPSAHVKRAAQESYRPHAFMRRRSMPWGDVDSHGLYFVAFGRSLSAFERVLRRMAGLDDGVVDGLLRFSRPVTGGAYWCPPVAGERLVLGGLEQASAAEATPRRRR